MTRINNPNFIGFDGEPLTGRIPPEVVVYGELSKQQLGELTHMYKLFCDANLTSVGQYLVQNRVMTDGTRVRMVSIQGRDQVYVWPVGGVNSAELPHGFAVVTEWSKPCIYGKKENGSWARQPDNVPQADKEILTHNTAEFYTAVPTFKSWPMVRQRVALWDAARHGGFDPGPSKPPVPVITAVGPKIFPHPAMAGIDGKLLDRNGGTVYQMSDSPNILVDLSDSVQHLPANTDSRASSVVLQSVRSAVISPSFEIVRYRFCNERLTTPAVKNTFVLVERNVVDLDVMPRRAQNSTTLNEAAATLNLTGLEEWEIGSTYVSFTLGSGFFVGYQTWVFSTQTGGAGRTIFVSWGYRENEVPISPEQIIISVNAFYEKRDETSAAAAETAKIVAAPGEAGISYYSWNSALGYPNDFYWRGGTELRYFNGSFYPDSFPPLSWTNFSHTRSRFNAEYTRTVNPEVSLSIAWFTGGKFSVFSGTGSGNLVGRVYVDRKTRSTNIDGSYESPDVFAATGTFIPGDQRIVGTVPSSYTIFFNENNEANAIATSKNAHLIAKRAEYSSNYAAVEDYVPQRNTVDYTLTSRHAIDFDSRAQFIAFIRVVVNCAGAEWAAPTYDPLDMVGTGGGGVLGQMNLISNPTYTVSIYFESEWVGVDGRASHSQLLATSTAVRPGFEFDVLQRQNVYSYPFTTDPIVFRMPPAIAPPQAAAEQLKTVASHQGVNPNLVAEFYKTGAEAHRSKMGIEYSTSRNGVEEPPSKFCRGMLYARTFKLSDISDALWLLHETKCDAAENNGLVGPAWFYMPDLKTTIDNQQFHIELRDGLPVTWSDDIPAKDGSTKPAPAARDIKLYQV